MKPGKHQRNKQRCQYLCWKIYDRAQSFVLLSYTMHEVHNWLVPQYRVNNYCVLCRVRGKKQNDNKQQKTLTSFTAIQFFSINYGYTGIFQKAYITRNKLRKNTRLAESEQEVRKRVPCLFSWCQRQCVSTFYFRPRLHGSGQIFARTNFVTGRPVYMDSCKFCCSGVYREPCNV